MIAHRTADEQGPGLAGVRRADRKWAETTLVVPFHDLDPLGIVWHGNYLKYFDIARFALFEKLGVDLHDYYRRHQCLFPVIKASTKYVVPLVQRDEIVCRASLAEARIKIVIDFSITRTADGVLCASGRSEQVAVQMPGREMLLKIPEDIRARMEA